MKKEELEKSIYERLDYYSDRFKEDGPCGAKQNGCRDESCDNRKRHFTDKNLYHNYAEFYSKLISDLAAGKEDFSLLELGVARGGSVAAWCESMPFAFVCGVDKNTSLLWIDKTKYSKLLVLEGLHGSRETYREIANKKFDIIIDDGSHQASEQKENFSVLQDFMSENGVYVIEDVYPSNTYDQEFLNRFELFDFSSKTGRFDDRVLVYKKK